MTCGVGSDFLEMSVGRERAMSEGGDWSEMVGCVSPRRIRLMACGL